MSDKPTKIVRTTRHVIENKLLTALTDESKVVIMAGEEDLQVMILALKHYSTRKAREMEKDFQKLFDSAFG